MERKKHIEQPDKPIPTFVFARVNANSLTGEGANLLITKLLYSLGVDRVKEEFAEYKAIVQDNGRVPRHEQQAREQIIPGDIVWMRLKTVEGLLTEKHTHERAAFRNPGHQSTHAPAYLKSSRTVVLVAGDERFLTQQIYFLFERTRWLYNRVIDTVIQVLHLKEAGTAKKWDNNTYVEFRPKSREEVEQYYPGNFNRAWEEAVKIRQMVSEDELLARIGATPTADAEEADADRF